MTLEVGGNLLALEVKEVGNTYHYVVSNFVHVSLGYFLLGLWYRNEGLHAHVFVVVSVPVVSLIFRALKVSTTNYF